MPAGKKRWAQSWGLAVTELKTREGMENRRAFTELWGISRTCVVEENSPRTRGAGEAGGAARIVAVWMLQVTSRKGSQDQCFEASEQGGEEAGKNAAGGSISSWQYRKEREKSLEAAEQRQPPGRTGEERT